MKTKDRDNPQEKKIKRDRWTVAEKIAFLTNVLKENNEDFEFYPTTDEILSFVYNDMNEEHYNILSILDIGAGRCPLKKYIQKKSNWNPSYFAIEKSQTLVSLFDSDVICLGSDFYETNHVKIQMFFMLFSISSTHSSAESFDTSTVTWAYFS